MPSQSIKQSWLGRNICIGIGTEIGPDFRDRVRERGWKWGTCCKMHIQSLPWNRISGKQIINSLKSRSKRDITNNFSALYSLECWMRWLVTHFTVAGNSGHQRPLEYINLPQCRRIKAQKQREADKWRHNVASPNLKPTFSQMGGIFRQQDFLVFLSCGPLGE